MKEKRRKERKKENIKVREKRKGERKKMTKKKERKKKEEKKGRKKTSGSGRVGERYTDSSKKYIKERGSKPNHVMYFVF